MFDALDVLKICAIAAATVGCQTRINFGDTIFINPAGFSDDKLIDVEAGINEWNISSLDQTGLRIEFSDSSDHRIRLAMDPSLSIVGSTALSTDRVSIRINTTLLDDDEKRSRLIEIVAHEVGHGLGLDDVEKFCLMNSHGFTRDPQGRKNCIDSVTLTDLATVHPLNLKKTQDTCQRFLVNPSK